MRYRLQRAEAFFGEQFLDLDFARRQPLIGRIRNSRLVFIEDAGHLIEIDQRARFVEVVRDFLGRDSS